MNKSFKNRLHSCTVRLCFIFMSQIVSAIFGKHIVMSMRLCDSPTFFFLLSTSTKKKSAALKKFVDQKEKILSHKYPTQFRLFNHHEIKEDW